MGKTSMTLGFSVGQQIAGQRRIAEEKVPIAYLYNGVQLPPLPEWNSEVFSSAAIYSAAVFGIVSDGYTLIIASGPLFMSGGVTSALKSTDTVTYRRCSYDAETETWGQLSDEATETINTTCQIRWANCDILNADGTLCLEASDPVPVYE